jgi:hypothetical protein
VRVEPGAVLAHIRSAPLSFVNITGVLDLAGGAFLSTAGTPATPVQALVDAGHNGGAWDGTSPTGAINSSLAASTPISDGVGYGLGSEIIPTTNGPFSIGADDTLVLYTLDGDTDLDGDADLDDVGRWALNFTGELGGVGATKTWTQGDWDHDGDVDLDDVGMWSVNFTGELGGGSGMDAAPPRAPAPARPSAWARSPFSTTRVAASVIV